MTILSSESLHVSCVAKDGRAILIAGRSGTGKSDLALRLIDRGAILVSDDYTIVRRVSGRLLAAAPATIKGRIEVRGLGVVALDTLDEAPVCLVVDLDSDVERMPQAGETMTIAGVAVPTIALAGLEPSAPIKAELALREWGLSPE